MIHPTQADVGRKVYYQDRPDGKIEYGRISSIREEPGMEMMVWVRYGVSSTGQLTPVDRLHWDG